VEPKSSGYRQIAEADFLDCPIIGERGDLLKAEPYRRNTGEDTDRCRHDPLTAEAVLGFQSNFKVARTGKAMSENGRFQSDDRAPSRHGFGHLL
jgi:hypothetical protein